MATCSTLLPGGTAEAPLQAVFFFFKLWFFVWWQPVFGNHFRVDDCDDTLSLVIMVGDALGGKRNWKRIHLQVVLNEHSALNVGGKVNCQGIKELQVVVVEFWTLEPTMSSAIITMGRSPTACPFGKPSLSNKISSWIFFHDFHCRYSNNVYIPGHHTLPDDMEQSWVTCHHQVLSGLFQSMPRQIVKAIEKIDSCTVRNAWKYKTNKNTNTIQILTQSGTHGKTTPWFAPGTAPVYGACGTLGGWEHERQRNVLKYFSAWNISRWPDGCKHDGKGHFGDCCSGNCDGFALGKIEEYKDMRLWYDYY